MPKAAYQLKRPQTPTTGVIFASPHSGCDYPAWFLKQTILDDVAIRSSEDAFVDQLFGAAPRFGAPFLTAVAPRAFLDLNRSPEELDPSLINDVKKGMHNSRIASGLGVIPRVVANARPIYCGKIDLAEAQARIDTYWRPYHAMMQTLMDEACAQFGRAVLIDCHSMPHEAIENVRFGGTRADVVLGDRFGAAASGDVVDRIESAFAGAGLRVVRNAPFAGAFITQHYGRPSSHQHVVQVEIDRGLYMDEARVTPNQNFYAFQRLITDVVEEIALIGRPEVRLAAE